MVRLRVERVKQYGRKMRFLSTDLLPRLRLMV